MSYRSFMYALRGISKALREEKSFRAMLVCFLLIVAAGVWLGVTMLEWAMLLLCCGAVLAAEMINTAVERAVDIASPEKNPLAGAAKDIAAGAVLVISLFAAAVGLIIFVPRFIALFKL